jgi:hypothetical protein
MPVAYLLNATIVRLRAATKRKKQTPLRGKRRGVRRS